jgi:hypothetical protein
VLVIAVVAVIAADVDFMRKNVIRLSVLCFGTPYRPSTHT